MICGANDIVGIETWANQKKPWLLDILELPFGIPSHDTISRILSLIEPSEFEQCFINWTNTIFQDKNRKGF